MGVRACLLSFIFLIFEGARNVEHLPLAYNSTPHDRSRLCYSDGIDWIIRLKLQICQKSDRRVISINKAALTLNEQKENKQYFRIYKLSQLFFQKSEARSNRPPMQFPDFLQTRFILYLFYCTGVS